MKSRKLKLEQKLSKAQKTNVTGNSQPKPKSLIYPLFTFFFYSHSPKEYHNLQEKYKNEFRSSILKTIDGREYYNASEENRKTIESRADWFAERKYPTPLFWHDIAGFFAVRMQNPVEAYRVIVEIWAIKNRKFRANRTLSFEYDIREIIDKELLETPEEFNKEFFRIVEETLIFLNEDFIRKKRFYFSLENNRLNWELIKTANIAKIIKELGPNWLYL